MNKSKVIIALVIFVVVLNFVFFFRIGQENYVGSQTSPQTGVGDLSLTGGQVTYGDDEDDSDFDDEDDGCDLVNVSPVAAPSPSSGSSGVPLSELSLHNSKEDCWIAYDGKVYDITSYIPRHPGGEQKIIPYCGSADAFESAFTKEHGTSKVKTLMNMGTFVGDFDVMGGLNG